MRLHVLGGVVAAVLTATLLVAPPSVAQSTVSATTDQLDAGESLVRGQELLSPNGRWALVLDQSGLMVYEKSPYANPQGPGALRGAVLSSFGIRTATLRADGNLVLFRDGVARVSSGTAGSGAIRLNVLDNGNVAMRNAAGMLVKHFDLHRVHRLAYGARLLPGDALHADRGRTTLTMQRDGNLVLRQNGRARWSSGTTAYPGAFAVMQTDDNLVVRDATGRARWSSGTPLDDAGVAVLANGALYIFFRGPGWWQTPTSYDVLRRGARLEPGRRLRSFSGDCLLTMQANGNLVLRCGGRVRWSSGTFFEGSSVTMQTDGNLVIRDATGRARWSTGTRSPDAYLLLFGVLSTYDDMTAPERSDELVAVVDARTNRLLWHR